jgi:hypothetical protein
MWIDRAVKWLLPREEHFFDLLEQGATRAHEISALLANCCAARSHADREAIVERMHQVEHEADRVIAEMYEALNRTFVTPLDRSDIYTLAVSLEEVADAVFATALQFIVHAMEDLPEVCRHHDRVGRVGVPHLLRPRPVREAADPGADQGRTGGRAGPGSQRREETDQPQRPPGPDSQDDAPRQGDGHREHLQDLGYLAMSD